VNAGSPTYPVDRNAVITEDDRLLTIALVNPAEPTQVLDLAIKGVALRNKGRHSVQVSEMPLGDVPKTLAVAPIGIDVYEIERR
jgi:hypothetical protein